MAGIFDHSFVAFKGSDSCPSSSDEGSSDADNDSSQQETPDAKRKKAGKPRLKRRRVRDSASQKRRSEAEARRRAALAGAGGDSDDDDEADLLPESVLRVMQGGLRPKSGAPPAPKPAAPAGAKAAATAVVDLADSGSDGGAEGASSEEDLDRLLDEEILKQKVNPLAHSSFQKAVQVQNLAMHATASAALAARHTEMESLAIRSKSRHMAQIAATAQHKQRQLTDRRRKRVSQTFTLNLVARSIEDARLFKKRINIHILGSKSVQDIVDSVADGARRSLERKFSARNALKGVRLFHGGRPLDSASTIADDVRIADGAEVHFEVLVDRGALQLQTEKGAQAGVRDSLGRLGDEAPPGSVGIRVQRGRRDARVVQLHPKERFAALFRRYAAEEGIALEKLRFTCDGDVIKEDQNLAALDLEEGDTIEVTVRG